MKKKTLFAAVLAAVVLVSCHNKQVQSETEPEYITVWEVEVAGRQNCTTALPL